MPGKYKDESASKCITEFVGLRSKMYLFTLDDKKDVSKAEVRVAKGVQKSVIFNDLRFSTYLNCLWNNEVKEHNFKTIHSMNIPWQPTHRLKLCCVLLKIKDICWMLLILYLMVTMYWGVKQFKCS